MILGSKLVEFSSMFDGATAVGRVIPYFVFRCEASKFFVCELEQHSVSCQFLRFCFMGVVVTTINVFFLYKRFFGVK